MNGSSFRFTFHGDIIRDLMVTCQGHIMQAKELRQYWFDRTVPASRPNEELKPTTSRSSLVE